ncbi:glycosyltransferase [Pedobacter hiemivivus]|uniref:Glycosyltransferase n=1 Tax=Pedobacter hiemivivus TaxID=2530454 RepID=A0A4R0N8C4_9SPHI|nr:glycosyltransferase [Pedobacter hiemivivus]TCC96235.1 glycosyltransferase [Pedobacter hiemivivus]
MSKVSICIPTYNSDAYLEESLNSIQNQTYTNIEVIIGDNCSSDNTQAIIKRYADENNWSYVFNQQNIGAGLNMNKLISLATGDFVAVYHSDDIYHPEIVAKSVSFFDQNQDCGFVSTLANLIDSNGEYLGELELPSRLRNNIKCKYTFEEIFPAILDSFVPFLVTPTVMVPKKIYDKLGMFKINDKYKSATDYEMWLRILKEFPAGILPEPLIQYRKHASQGSQMEIRENYGIPDGLNVYEEYAAGNRYFEKKYKRIFSWLIFLQVLKLNNARNFKESSKMVQRIHKHGNFKYGLFAGFFNLFNISSIRFNINFLDRFKGFFIKTKKR